MSSGLYLTYLFAIVISINYINRMFTGIILMAESAVDIIALIVSGSSGKIMI